MTHLEVRKQFKQFFSKHQHTWLKSWPLIPYKDPSLLFVNAGMNQFKNIFLGISAPQHPNIITIQKCLRAGGKHNDLNEVGPSLHHHTFFEMMGNFSFGSYFKEEACHLAWSFLTQELNIPKENMAVSVFKEDKETAEIWNKKISIPKERIFFFGEEDNFWRMGEQGPCGPCSEIYFDPHAFRSKKNTMFEIWNLVFMQYKEDENKKRTPLSTYCIDTGMGLERLLALLQNKSSNYHTDLFSPILKQASQVTGIHYDYDSLEKGEILNTNSTLRILADHIRAGTFLIGDGVKPSNEGRGYVLRRILRRAVYHGTQMSQNKFLLSQIASAVIQNFASVYPELDSQKNKIKLLLDQEEEQFLHTLNQGKIRLEKELLHLKKKGIATLSGETCFQLYDTYGFPFDLVELICKKQGINVQTQIFEKKMKESKLKSKKASSFAFKKKSYPSLDPSLPASLFTGYKTLKSSSRLLALFDDTNKEQKILKSPCRALAVFDQTCFYAEGGGQVGDQGQIYKNDKFIGHIEDCQNIKEKFVHTISIKEESLSQGNLYQLEVSSEHRKKTAIHHSATHLLHSALRRTLGEENTKQAGSLVTPDRLRFDFTAEKALSEEQQIQVEDNVNMKISEAIPVQIHFKDYHRAMKDGALSFFEKPQTNKVRILQMSDFSMELCGGTHVQNTSDIRYFKIISESSVSSGVRRIEAICGQKALDYVTHLSRENLKARKYFHLSSSISSSLIESIEKQQNQIQKLKKSKTSALHSIPDSIETFEWNAEKISLYLKVLEINDHDSLSTIADQIQQKFSPAIAVLAGSFKNGSAPIVVSFPKNLAKKISASSIIRLLGGKGGGPPTFAKGVLNQLFNQKTLEKKFLSILQSS